MHIKRFEAPTMPEALRMVKNAFGPDAVILEVRHRGGGGMLGFLRKSRVEITAAADRPVRRTPRIPPAIPKSPEPPRETETRRRARTAAACGQPSLPPREPRREAVEPGMRAVSDLHRRLAAHEVDDALAWELVEAAARILPGGAIPPDGLAKALARVLQSRSVPMGPRDARNPAEPRAVALVGSTGVGKTTTAAKLAARMLARGRRPALLTLDQERIGGVEQLRIFARAMGLPFESVRRPADLPGILERLDTPDLILDTPGTAPRDAEGIARLGDAVHRIPGVDTVLVVAAAARERDLDFALRQFGAVPVHRIAVTKLDEAAVCGALLHLAVRSPVPLAFFSEGPRVPEDLEPASIPGLVRRLCGAAPPRRRDRSEPIAPAAVVPAEGFVANRNSDRFHRADCPAVRQIRPENRVLFASAADAAARRYSPCKRCGADAAPDAALVSPARFPAAL